MLGNSAAATRHDDLKTRIATQLAKQKRSDRTDEDGDCADAIIATAGEMLREERAAIMEERRLEQERVLSGQPSMAHNSRFRVQVSAFWCREPDRPSEPV